MNNRRCKRWTRFSYFLLVLVAAGCVETSGSVMDEIPLPKSAYEIKKHVLEAESASQLSFKITVPYPDTTMMNFYSDFFGKKVWSKCESDDAWLVYNKRADDKVHDTPIRQNLRYLASKNQKHLAAVALRYLGYRDPHTGELRWNSEVQQVTVIIYNLRDKDFEKTLSLLSLKCDSKQQ